MVCSVFDSFPQLISPQLLRSVVCSSRHREVTRTPHTSPQRFYDFILCKIFHLHATFIRGPFSHPFKSLRVPHERYLALSAIHFDGSTSGSSHFVMQGGTANAVGWYL